MYNSAAVCDYATDDEYRACLLLAFEMTEYSDEIVHKINALYESPLGQTLYPTATVLAQANGMSRDLAFCLLFNYDNFKNTHLALAQ